MAALLREKIVSMTGCKRRINFDACLLLISTVLFFITLPGVIVPQIMDLPGNNTIGCINGACIGTMLTSLAFLFLDLKKYRKALKEYRHIVKARIDEIYS